MDGIVGSFLGTDEPAGSAIAKFLFYIGIIYILWTGLGQLWNWIQWFDNDWDEALWGIIKTPFLVLFRLLMLRLGLDVVLSIFKIRDDLSEARKSAKSAG